MSRLSPFLLISLVFNFALWSLAATLFARVQRPGTGRFEVVLRHGKAGAAKRTAGKSKKRGKGPKLGRKINRASAAGRTLRPQVSTRPSVSLSRPSAQKAKASVGRAKPVSHSAAPKAFKESSGREAASQTPDNAPEAPGVTEPSGPVQPAGPNGSPPGGPEEDGLQDGQSSGDPDRGTGSGGGPDDPAGDGKGSGVPLEPTPEPISTPTPTAVPTATPIPTATPTPRPAPTAIPLTPTPRPEPTPTPRPTATPVPPTPKPEPTATPRPKGTTRAAVPTRQVQPQLPEELKKEDFRTSVRVRVEIAADGSSMPSLRASSGNAQVDEQVLKALRRWRWKPALQDGETVSSVQNFRFDFQVR